MSLSNPLPYNRNIFQKLILIALFLTACHSNYEIEQTLAKEFLQIDDQTIKPGTNPEYLSGRMKVYGVPGVSIALIEDFQIKWVRGFGFMDKSFQQAVTDSTLFQAGSVSKPVAAFGALKLVEMGMLDLDANANNFLTSWQIPDNQFTKDKKVSLRLLLCHGAGIAVHGFQGYNTFEDVPTLINILNGEAPANSYPIRVDNLPGENFRYSGGGYCIIQQMMIDVSGKSFPEIMDNLVLKPLNMQNSTYLQPLPSSRIQQAATGYLPTGMMTKGKRHIYPELAAAGLWTTAKDLALFVVEIQNALQQKTNIVLTQKSVNQMLTQQVAPYVGLGIFLQPKKEEIYFEHSGWDEGFCSLIIGHPTNGYGAAILINANQPDLIDELIAGLGKAYQWEGF